MPDIDPFTYLKLVRGDWDNGEDNFLFTVKVGFADEKWKEDMVEDGKVRAIPEPEAVHTHDYRIQHKVHKCQVTEVLLDDIERMESDRLYSPGPESRPEYLGNLIRALMEFKI